MKHAAPSKPVEGWDGTPFSRRSRGPRNGEPTGQIPAVNRFLDVLGGNLDSLGPVLEMVRRKYEALPSRERRRLGSLSDFLQEVVTDGLRQWRSMAR